VTAGGQAVRGVGVARCGVFHPLPPPTGQHSDTVCGGGHPIFLVCAQNINITISISISITITMSITRHS